MRARGSQGGQVEGLERADAEKTAQFHRGENNERLEQGVVDESAGHGQRLVKSEEQGHAHCRKRLKPVDGHDADENSQEYGGGSAAWVKLLLQ
jgi:hypothetical protein